MLLPARIALFGFFLLATLSSARAAKLTIEWEVIPGAAQYEIELSLQRRVVSDEKIPAPQHSWVSEQPAGAYGYRLRTLDAGGHPGEWTPILPLMLSPTSPVPISPGSGETVGESGAVMLRWGAVTDAQRYQLEVFRSTEMVYSETLAATESRVDRLRPGRYFWRVRSLTDLAQAAPDGRRVLVSHPSETRAFIVGTAPGAAVPATAPGEKGAHLLKLSLGVLVMPYEYQAKSDSSGARTYPSSATSSGIVFGAGYAVSSRFRLNLGMDYVSVPFNQGVTGTRFDLGLGGRYVTPLGGDPERWHLGFGGELEARQFFTILPTQPGSSGQLLDQFLAWGPALSAELSRELSRIELGLRIAYFFPVALGNGLDLRREGASLGTASLSLEGRYDLGADWAIEFSAGRAWRGIRYGTGTETREAHLDSYDLTLGLSRAFAL